MPTTLAAMEARAEAIAKRRGGRGDLAAGTSAALHRRHSARPKIWWSRTAFRCFRVGRGGQYTYHGPGQRVIYVMLDRQGKRGGDVRCFVAHAGKLGDRARWPNSTWRVEIRPGRVGVWVEPDRRARTGRAEDKIAAIGIKIRRWVSFHGISINVEPDLGHFDGIVPCGIRDHGVTSLVDLGLPVTMAEADAALRAAFEPVFGAVVDYPLPQGEGGTRRIATGG
jgi:lipoyl(octanoyl) transferase